MDLTDPHVAPNLTKHLEQNYPIIGQASDEEGLKSWAIEAANHYLGSSLSKINHARFMKALASKHGLPAIQKYLTDYMLKGAGLGVMRNSIDSIASMVQEDVDEVVKLSTEQILLKKLVEDNSDFEVGLIG